MFSKLSRLKYITGAVALCILNAHIAKADTVLDFNAISSSNASQMEKAERLALAAERLAYSDGLPFATQYFQQAIQLDPNNLRAQLYISILKVVDAQKGLAKRITPVIMGFRVKDRQEYFRRVDGLAKGNVYTSLTQGPADIKSEKESTQHIYETVMALNELRQTLATLKDSGRVLEVNVVKPRNDLTANDMIKDCPVQQTRQGVFHLATCSDARRIIAKLNFADFEAMRLMTGGAMTGLAPALGYETEGLIKVLKKFSNGKGNDKRVMSEIKNQPKLGSLKDVRYMALIKSMGAEAVEGYRMANRYQSQQCRAGVANRQNRPGQFFNFGFCTDKIPSEHVEKGLVTLSRSQDWSFQDNFGDQHSTTINGNPFLTGQIVDLKTMVPNSFDRCGNAKSLGDPTFGGTLPNGDAASLIRIENKDFLNQFCSPWAKRR